MAEPKPKTLHVAILVSPGMGHLIPLIELAKRLVVHHSFSVTIMVPTTGPLSDAQKSILDSLPSPITSMLLPPVDLNDVVKYSRAETLVSLTVSRSLPSLRDALKSLAAGGDLKTVSLVVDLFCTDAFDVAREFGISPYIFFPSTAMCLSLFFYLPKLDEMVSCEYRELEEVRIPGCIPISGSDLLDPVQDRKNDAYKLVLHHAKRYRLADGVMVNSFMELESGAIKALQMQGKEPGNPPVYPVGPLVNMGGSGSGVDGSDCLKWLDDQPRGSVLFVSFGSGGTLSYDQIIELAWGLEMSEQKFLWVIRSPSDVSNSTYFSAQSQMDPFDFLPNGFLNRTKERGLVVPSWAPQARVLSHGSTAGFLTHCGWNSVLESVVNGMPLIAWPLYAEQNMNAVMLTKEIKVALRPKVGENGVIGREEIAKVVRGLMESEEGKKIRNRMKDLKEAASNVLSEDGSSTKALSEVALKWKNQK